MLNGLASIYISVNVIKTFKLDQAISDMIRDYYNMRKTTQNPNIYPVIPESNYEIFQVNELYTNYKMKRKSINITINDDVYLLVLNN